MALCLAHSNRVGMHLGGGACSRARAWPPQLPRRPPSPIPHRHGPVGWPEVIRLHSHSHPDRLTTRVEIGRSSEQRLSPATRANVVRLIAPARRVLRKARTASLSRWTWSVPTQNTRSQRAPASRPLRVRMSASNSVHVVHVEHRPYISRTRGLPKGRSFTSFTRPRQPHIRRHLDRPVWRRLPLPD